MPGLPQSETFLHTDNQFAACSEEYVTVSPLPAAVEVGDLAAVVRSAVALAEDLSVAVQLAASAADLSAAEEDLLAISTIPVVVEVALAIRLATVHLQATVRR